MAYSETPLRGEGSRVVESQSAIATMGLVDTVEQQRLLEELLEQTKPSRIPTHVNYLIGTPFRYPPLESGSRFGTHLELGIFYGSETRATALAETAFYALRFVRASHKLDGLSVTKTHFRFAYDTAHGLDTTTTHFDTHRLALMSPDDYTASQALGRAARDQGIEIVRFPSTRCPWRGINLAVFELKTLAASPVSKDHWYMKLHQGRVDFIERHTARPATYSFSAMEFEQRGVMGHPSAPPSTNSSM